VCVGGVEFRFLFKLCLKSFVDCVACFVTGAGPSGGQRELSAKNSCKYGLLGNLGLYRL